MRPRALGAAFTILLATGGAARAAGPPTLTVGVRAGADSLDPAGGGDSPLAREIWRLVLPGLTDQSPDTLAVIPGLASAWNPSADGRAYTYELRDRLQWSDGQPVTPADVVYSIERARDERWPGVGEALADLEAEAIDDRHVVVRSAVIDTRLPLLDLPILPRHVFDSLAPAASDADLLRVGAGPFTLAERGADFVRLVANDRYYGGRPMLDEVTFRVFESGSAQVEALAAKSIDVATDLDHDAFDRINANEKITALTVNEGGYWALVVDTRDGAGALRDAAVRRALNLAVDRSVIVDEALGGVGHPAVLPVVSRSRLWELDPERYDGYGFDPVGASELLDGAGLVDRDSDGRREDSEGRALVLRLLVPAEPPEALAAVELVAAWLDDIGLGVEVVEMPGTVESSAGELDEAGPFDLALVERTPVDDPTPLLAGLSCVDGSSGAYWCDAEYDRLFAEQATELDPATREQLVEEMLLRLQDQAPEVLLVRPDVLQAFRNDRYRKWAQQPRPDGPIVFSATSPSYLLVESSPEVGHDELSTALLIAGTAAAAGMLALATVTTLAVRHRRAARPPTP